MDFYHKHYRCKHMPELLDKIKEHLHKIVFLSDVADMFKVHSRYWGHSQEVKKRSEKKKKKRKKGKINR